MAGYQQLLRGWPLRAKFRNSFEKPEPMTPGKVEEMDFTVPDINHTFRRDHRIMVQVQSSWFPLTDRNPQTFVNIPDAKPSDFVKATSASTTQKRSRQELRWEYCRARRQHKNKNNKRTSRLTSSRSPALSPAGRGISRSPIPRLNGGIAPLTPYPKEPFHHSHLGGLLIIRQTLHKHSPVLFLQNAVI